MKSGAAIPKSIDAHIAGFPPDVQEKLETLRQTIHKTAPGVEEAMKYGIPTFVLDGTNLIFFGGYKNHIGLYPGTGAIAAFRKEISKYKLSKGTIQLPLDKALPLGLVGRIVRFRIKENQARAMARKKKK